MKNFKLLFKFIFMIMFFLFVYSFNRYLNYWLWMNTKKISFAFLLTFSGFNLFLKYNSYLIFFYILYD